MENKKLFTIHHVIVFLLCFFFRFLPPIGPITPYGMGILGTFIAAIYGWSTIGMIWPSFMCLVGIGMSVGVNNMIGAGFSMMIIAMIFVFVLMDVLQKTGSVTYLVNRILGSKFAKGKPWLVLFLLFVAAYVGGVLNSMMMAVVFVGVFTTICKNLNIQPYTKLPTFMMIGAALSLLMGQIGLPVMGNALMLIMSYNAMFPEPLNFLGYMLFMIPMGFFVIFVYILLMRFVFRVDVTPLKEFDANEVCEVKKATRDQKLAIGFFVVYMVLVTLSSLAVLQPVYNFLGQFGMFGFIALILCAMMVIKGEDGQPLLNFHMSAARIGWDPVLMLAFIMCISNFMNTEETGISAAMMGLLTPFTSLPPVVFIVLALFIAMIMTNFATNLIVVVLVMPVLYNFAAMIGMSTDGIMCLLFICSHLAIATAAASPAAGISMTATEIIEPKAMMKYAALCLPFLFIACLLVGIPFSNIIF